MLNDKGHSGKKRRHRSRKVIVAVWGVAIVLSVASLSAYYISGKEKPVQPGNGVAQAMALASSKSSTR